MLSLEEFESQAQTLKRAENRIAELELLINELEKQIEQIRELARDSEVDVSQQLLQLETLAARRRIRQLLTIIIFG